VPSESTASAQAFRVKIAQGQAGRSLMAAMAFAVAAPVAAVVAHRTGTWLPLHLFLVGSVLLAISGATRLFVITWSAAEPVTGAAVVAQRWLLVAGAAGLAIARERAAPAAVMAAAGLCVSASLALLGGLLVVETRRSRIARFRPAAVAYVIAVAAGLVGTALGAAMVTGEAAVRDAHVILNLLGLVGIVIAGTLPFFVATQVRMKMSSAVTPRRLYATIGVLAVAVLLATAAAVFDAPRAVAVGLALYAVGLVALIPLLPRPGRKQLRWAGPRLVGLALGLCWWIAAVGAAGVEAVRHGDVFPEKLLGALVIGGYAQILLASAAYLGPVLRGGGHERLSHGFGLTRSWTVLAAVNLASVAWLLQLRPLVTVATGAVACEVAIRAVRLASANDQPSPQAP
jgi:nitrite reductase (NO-forming)